MSVSKDDLAFVEQHRAAAMITVAADGRPKVARVGLETTVVVARGR